MRAAHALIDPKMATVAVRRSRCAHLEGAGSRRRRADRAERKADAVQKTPGACPGGRRVLTKKASQWRPPGGSVAAPDEPAGTALHAPARAWAQWRRGARSEHCTAGDDPDHRRRSGDHVSAAQRPREGRLPLPGRARRRERVAGALAQRLAGAARHHDAGPERSEILRRMRLDPMLADIPVIFVTGRTDAATRIQCLAMGAVGFVVKPFHASDVLSQVRQALERPELRRGLGRGPGRSPGGGARDRVRAGLGPAAAGELS